MSTFNFIESEEKAESFASLTSNNDDDIRDYMRPIDIALFRRYSIYRGIFVLVRRTNPKSIQYVGKPGFVPKPLQCKPKTAQTNVEFSENGIKIKSQCAGLVVDPRLTKEHAFGNDKLKWVMARRTWKKYWGHTIPNGFAIQEDKSSKYYGCVMRGSGPCDRIYPRSQYNKDIAKSIDRSKIEGIPDGHSYIHGDYDLYALIDMNNMSTRTCQEALFEGQKHKHSKGWGDFEKFANHHMQVDMIQHGSQEHFCEHTDEEVDIFAPFLSRHLQVRKIIGLNGLKRLYHDFFERHTQGEKMYIAGDQGVEVINF